MERLEETRRDIKSWTELRSSMIATVGAFCIAFLGSWIQLNGRISKVETHVEHHSKQVDKLDDLNNNVQRLIEQNQWIIEELRKEKK